MKVYLIFVFLLAAPVLVRLASTESSNTPSPSADASLASQEAAVPAPDANRSPPPAADNQTPLTAELPKAAPIKKKSRSH